MIHQNKSLRTADGIELNLNAWITEHAIADIIFCHGFMEHSGRYQDLAHYFCEHKINLFGFDTRHHGKSSGDPRAYLSDFSKLIQDFKQVFEYYRKDSNKPVFLFGHSLGGLVVVSFLLEHKEVQKEISGVLLSAPLLQPNADMAPILQKLSGFVSALLPKLKTIKIDSSEISRDPERIVAYDSDPLICRNGIHAKTGDVFLQQMKWIAERFDQLNCPLIIQHSKSDKLTEHEGSKLLFEAASSEDKVFISLDAYKHEIFRDLGADQVLDDYWTWLSDRIPTSTL